MENFAANINLYLQSSAMTALAAAFVGGILASFTPCVYPMIPITASYVGAGNLGGSKLRGFTLSLIYILGLAVTYACLGMFAALSGRFFGEIGSNPWVYLAVANVIIVFGLGMLEVFTIPMVGLNVSAKPAGKMSVFFVGLASGFVAGPCTAPVMGVLLAYVATTRDIVFGGALLFVFALGMGVLLVAVGTFSGLVAALPRSGEWMVKIKKAMGLFMIALGEYFLVKAGQLMF